MIDLQGININKVTVSVQGQTVGVVCRASVNCTGGPVDDLGRTTERGCCVDNPLGLAYVGGEGLCVPCIGEYTSVIVIFFLLSHLFIVSYHIHYCV